HERPRQVPPASVGRTERPGAQPRRRPLRRERVVHARARPGVRTRHAPNDLRGSGLRLDAVRSVTGAEAPALQPQAATADACHRPAAPPAASRTACSPGSSDPGTPRTDYHFNDDPVWYSVTRVSKKFFSFFRSMASDIHGNGFSVAANSGARPSCVQRRLVMKCM